MPQLDLITFSLQLGLIILLQWTLIHILISIIIPSYLILQKSKRILYQFINQSTLLFKQYAIKNWLYFINYISQFVFVNIFLVQPLDRRIKKIAFLKKYKDYLIVFFKEIFLKISYCFKKKHYYQLNLKASVNYLLINNLHYGFYNKYNFLFPNRLTKIYEIIVKKILQYRLREDEAIIPNLILKSNEFSS